MNRQPKIASVRFYGRDRQLYEKIRKIAKEQRRSVSSLLVEVIDDYLRDRGVNK